VSWHDAEVDDAFLIGGVLVAGLVIFLVGAVAWRLDYQRPLEEALPAIHRDRGRRAWIHTWMIAALVVTPAGLVGLTVALEESAATVLAGMATAVYAAGGVCWIVSLTFRLTVVPWAAERATAGHVPEGFEAFDRWAGSLYVVHMLTAYMASAVLGMAVLASDDLPVWLGWAGILWGLAFAAGFVVTRFAGPFNPPFWAHLYTGTVGLVLLLG
jgi:hypothetical protein